MTQHEWQTYVRQTYVRIGSIQARPYIVGEDLTDISVSDQDDPATNHGMIARNPENLADQWYVAREYFAANYTTETSLKKSPSA